MNGTVQMPRKIEYRNFRREQARVRAARDSHAVAVQIADANGRVPQGEVAGFIYDLRRGRRRIYGSLLLTIDTAADIARKSIRTNPEHAARVRDAIKQIPRVLDAYIDEVLPDPSRAA